MDESNRLSSLSFDCSAVHNWSCRCKCEAAQALVAQKASTYSFATNDYTSAGCFLGKYIEPKVDCDYGSRTMAIAFTNDNFQSGGFPWPDCSSQYTVRANIGVNGGPPAGFVNPSPSLDLKVSAVQREFFRTLSLPLSTEQIQLQSPPSYPANSEVHQVGMLQQVRDRVLPADLGQEKAGR